MPLRFVLLRRQAWLSQSNPQPQPQRKGRTKLPTVTTPVAIRYMRNSERSTYRRCRLKWHWSYNLGLGPQREKGALTFGTLVHEALAEFYPPGRKRGPNPVGVFSRLYEANKKKFSQWDEDGERFDALSLGEAMLTEYVRQYGDDDHIEIVAPEMAFQVDVHDQDGAYMVTWVGRGDAVYVDLSRSTKDKKIVGMLEHKTAKVVDREVRINSSYGEQALGYWWGASIVLRDKNLLPPGSQIDHVLFNWLRKGKPDERPRNAAGHYLNKPGKDALLKACFDNAVMDQLPKKPTMDDAILVLNRNGIDIDQFGEVSKVQPSPLLHRQAIDFGNNELATINRRIREEAWEMAQVRAKRLPILKNPTKDCGWECGFVDACELHEMGADFESVLDLEMQKWEPYSDHEMLEEKGRA